MTVDALSAAKAYGNQLKMMTDTPEESSQAADGSQSSFKQLLEKIADDAVKSQSTSEAHQMQSLTEGSKSQVDHLSDVVTAVANAELSLNTVVAVRDRVINAYNDIIKMSI